MTTTTLPKTDWDAWHAGKRMSEPRRAIVEKAITELDKSSKNKVILTVQGVPCASITSDGIAYSREPVANAFQFFTNRRLAIAKANQLTKASEEQHTAIRFEKSGWLVKNVVRGNIIDASEN